MAATAAKPAVSKPAAAPPAGKPAAASTGSNSSKSATTSVTGSTKTDAATGGMKPSLKPAGDPPAAGPPAPAILLWPDGKPILGSDGKPLDPATLTVVVEKDGKSVVHGPDGKPFLLPDGKALDPALIPPKEEAPGPPPPKPYLGVPPPRFTRPPWKKTPWQGPSPPRFLPYSPSLVQATKLELPAQVEFQDGEWGRTLIDLKRKYPKVVSLYLGPVAVTFEKHSGPCQCFIQTLMRDVPDFPELVGKPQFSTCNFLIR